MTDKLTLLAIFAHPDDEAFGSGGTLTKYAHEGVDVHLVKATRGEAGQVFDPDIRLTQPIGLLREQEMRNACATYGLSGLHFLGYMDGQTTIAPQSDAVYKVVKLLRQLKPQVVLSFGPEGVYGHYDIWRFIVGPRRRSNWPPRPSVGQSWGRRMMSPSFTIEPCRKSWCSGWRRSMAGASCRWMVSPSPSWVIRWRRSPL